MKGYIYLETHPDKPGQIRILSQDDEPSPQQQNDNAQIRYIAKFRNAHIAYMHVHNTLKKKLQDINTRFYEVSLPEAIAAVECEDLPYERIWIDPALTESELKELDKQTATLQHQHQRVDKIYLFVGGLGLLLLMFILLGGVWHV
ncbi:MAG: hypothetical protein R3F02_08720 [Thiolinea sp.]